MPQPLAGLHAARALLHGRVAPPRARAPSPGGPCGPAVSPLTRCAGLREVLALLDQTLAGPAAARRGSVLVGVAAHCAQGGCRLSHVAVRRWWWRVRREGCWWCGWWCGWWRRRWCDARHVQIAARMADLPEPFSPVMKLTCGPNSCRRPRGRSTGAGGGRWVRVRVRVRGCGWWD